MRLKKSIDAEATAIAALSFIASDPERLVRFLSVTGITPQTLRSAAQDPSFLAQVMEYVAADEALLMTFAANEGVSPEAVARAYQALNAQHES